MKKSLLLFVFFVALSFNSFAQNWTQLSSTDLEIPFSEAIIKHGSDWYLGVPGGVFKTSNGGDSWTLVNNNLYASLGRLRVEGFCSSGSNLIAINRWDGLAYTSNGGSSWNQISDIPDNYYFSQNIVKIGSTLLIVATTQESPSTSYIYYSTNDGINWTQGAQVVGAIREPEIFSNGTTAFISHTNNDNNDEFIGITTNGTTIDALPFSSAYSGTSIDNVVFSGNYLIVSGDGSLQKYDLVGSGGWTDITILQTDPDVVVIVFISLVENGSGKLFASILNSNLEIGFYSSADQGDTWTTENVSMSLGAEFALGLHAVGNEVMACFIDEGIHYTSDITTTNLSRKNSGLLASDFEDFFITPNGNFLTSLFISGPYGSNNSGANWSKWNTGYSLFVLEHIYGYISDGTNVYANYSNEPDENVPPQDVYKSTDNGVSWTKVDYPETLDNVKVVGTNGTTIFAKSIDKTDPNNPFNRYYKSTDAAATWVEITTIPSTFTPSAVSGNGTTVFMVGLDDLYKPAIYTSVNDGTDWTLSMSGINTADLESYQNNDDFIPLVTATSKAFVQLRFSGWNNKIMRWTGSGWETATAAGAISLDLESIAYHNNVLFISPWNGGVYISYDNGENFTATNNLPDGINARIFAFEGDMAYISTNRGIWQLTIPTDITTPITSNKFSISPNPADDVITVVAKTIRIYNSSGNLVKTISVVNNQADISDLAKGIYIVKAETDSGTYTSKLVKK